MIKRNKIKIKCNKQIFIKIIHLISEQKSLILPQGSTSGRGCLMITYYNQKRFKPPIILPYRQKPKKSDPIARKAKNESS